MVRPGADLESPLVKALVALDALRSDPQAKLCVRSLGQWALRALDETVTNLLGSGSLMLLFSPRRMVPDLGRQVQDGTLRLDRDTRRWLFSEVATCQANEQFSNAGHSLRSFHWRRPHGAGSSSVTLSGAGSPTTVPSTDVRPPRPDPDPGASASLGRSNLDPETRIPESKASSGPHWRRALSSPPQDLTLLPERDRDRDRDPERGAPLNAGGGVGGLGPASGFGEDKELRREALEAGAWRVLPAVDAWDAFDPFELDRATGRPLLLTRPAPAPPRL
eukprot:tig00020902_g15066.t1